ncbi:unnamed protein product [Microthlaspi erraticum]|uniref:HSF-type DNA-binding domain-containing protein n=1 Tax=Microthlaspi erraticum TaxID=1685480 RepID=A0A6D2L5V7_9BRAS|nr:unnamed protein product [Microthlaspi erraticum]
MTHSFPRGLPSFYIRVYKIVDDPSLDPIISWSKSNNSFIVWNVEEFCRVISPKSVGLGRSISRFFCDLRYHGFKRINGRPGRLEFGHDDFVRGQPQLLKKMMVKTWTERMEKNKAKKARAKARKARVKVEHLLQNLQI